MGHTTNPTKAEGYTNYVVDVPREKIKVFKQFFNDLDIKCKPIGSPEGPLSPKTKVKK